MIGILKKLRVLLDRKQKLQMVGLVPLMIIGAAFETASIALVLSVVTAIITPESLEKNKFVYFFYNAFGFKDVKTFTIVSMVLLIGAFILKNVYLFLEWKVQYAFVYRNQFNTSEKMLKSYLKRGYEYYLYADTAVVQRSITSDVNNMYGLILSLLTIASEAVVAASLIVMIFLVEPLMCVIIGILLLVTMIVITKILKPVMHRSGQENQDFYAGLFKWISQIVQGIKEVKVTGKEKYFINEYKKCGTGYVNAVERYSLYNNTPKLLIETVCISGMIGYLLVMVITGQDISTKVPSLSAFAFAAMKLMPSANKINNQINAISFFEPFLKNVSDNLLTDISDENTDMSFVLKESEKLPVKQGITLKDITYRYPKTEKYIFKNAEMEIPIGKAVGVVGQSGAGKTTIVDILLGLLELEGGGVYADNVNIKDDYRGWLKNIGYIPQMIYMLDGTIRQNVAFGVSEEEMSEERVWEVLKEAHLDDFIRSLPEGLDTEIGERGIRLSGGQRQRIGIARALYNDPEVLVLDEATSALDNDTEAAIMESINSLHGRKTLIIIAHRLQTIEKCDMIYRVKDGKITKE
jgi:ABC-type multidrug transport system fused ATPase/permease subunit